MNKFEFINNLLETNKFSTSQKERFLKLVSQELINLEDKDAKVLEELKLIKSKIEIAPDNQLFEKNHIVDVKTSDPKEIKLELPKEYLDPKNLSNFLISYNQDSMLKYTCHTMDDKEIIESLNKANDTDKYDIIKYQQKLNEAFEKISKEHKINKKIYSLINCYLNGGGTWSTDKIEVNWKSQNLIDWCSLNENKVPHPGKNLVSIYKSRGFIFKAFKSSLNGQKINSFSKLVIHFKNHFHIRADNSLKELILFKNNEKWGGKIDFEINDSDFWENLELFTDIDKLLQAYDKLMDIIIFIAREFNLEKPKVKISFKEVDSDIVLSIHHLNSVFKKTLNNLKKRLGEKHTDLILNQINGLCDLYIRADFDHGQYGEVNLWNGKDREKIKLEKFKGVEHILVFKR